MPEGTVCSQSATCPYTLKPLCSPPAPCLPQEPSCCHFSWLANRPHQAQTLSVSPSLLFALHPFLILLLFSHGELHRIPPPPSLISPAVPQPLSSSSIFSFSHAERRSTCLRLAFFLLSAVDVSLPPLPRCSGSSPWQEPGSAGSSALRGR